MPEEEEAREYCLHRPLKRPRINAIVLMCLIVLNEYVIRAVADWMSRTEYATLALGVTSIQCYWLVSFVSLLLLGRWWAVLFVLLYQRYAPEATRRKCKCKPSCSEYALVAFRRYGLVWGGYKVFIRLTRTCRGSRYVVDYP